MEAMCPAEEHQVPVPPSEAGNGQLASDGASGTVEWAYVSDPGTGRENNEDFAGAWAPDGGDRAPLFVVADGMGGHAAGELASTLATQAVAAIFTGKSADQLEAAVRAADRLFRLVARQPGTLARFLWSSSARPSSAEAACAEMLSLVLSEA